MAGGNQSGVITELQPGLRREADAKVGLDESLIEGYQRSLGRGAVLNADRATIQNGRVHVLHHDLTGRLQIELAGHCQNRPLEPRILELQNERPGQRIAVSIDAPTRAQVEVIPEQRDQVCRRGGIRQDLVQGGIASKRIEGYKPIWRYIELCKNVRRLSAAEERKAKPNINRPGYAFVFCGLAGQSREGLRDILPDARIILPCKDR